MNEFNFNDIDDHLSSYKEDFQPDVAAGLARLRGRVGGGPGRAATVRRLGFGRWLSVAATVLLLLVAGFLLLNRGTAVTNDGPEPMAFDLPDGTGVLLQQGATLGYATDYNEADRLITLDGQAYFEVHKDADRPFLVRTEETELRVTGTAFNLRVDDGELEVEVSEGAVNLLRQGETTAVTAKHCGLALPGKKCTLMKAENLNRHAWRTGKLTFQGTPLPQALTTIRNNYGLKISLSPAGCSFPLSGAFAADDPEAVLRTIAQLGGGSISGDAGKGWTLTGLCAD